MHIPVVFAGGTAGDAYLVEGDAALPAGAYGLRFTLPAFPGHVAGCGCCVPRGPAVEVLATMFLARATGAAPYFNRLVVHASVAGEAAVRQAVTQDVLAMARYRLAD